MEFAAELESTLPLDLPHRGVLIEKATAHLQLIVEVNQYMNLTRIVSVRDAVLKHVLDSLLPWQLFHDAKSVLDAGTGAGFPGVPLAIALPGTRFLLAESVQKKARFVQSVAEALALPNVETVPERAEDVLRSRSVEIITARAMAPLDRAIGYFAPALKRGARALLYKGPEAETEIAGAEGSLRKHKLRASVVHRYDLPDDMGTRTVIEVAAASYNATSPNPTPTRYS